MIRRVALVLVLALLTVACAGDEARFGPPLDCDSTRQGRLLLLAQAVPDAQQIPCLAELPPRWELTAVETRTSEGVLTLTNAALDVTAEVRFLPSCPGVVPGAAPGVTPFRDPEPVFTFEGGCVSVDFVGDSREEEQNELLESIRFISREDLRSSSGWEL